VSGGVLVAGIGNIFSSDDGFGVEVANRLAAEADLLPAGTRVKEYGIRGVHLAYELLDGCDVLILVDALAMEEPPGTVAVIEPEPGGGISTDDDPPAALDAHSMSPDVVLGTLSHLGGEVGRVLIVGCQPATLADGIGLSPPVAAAVDGAVELCQQLAREVATPTTTGAVGGGTGGAVMGSASGTVKGSAIGSRTGREMP